MDVLTLTIEENSKKNLIVKNIKYKCIKISQVFYKNLSLATPSKMIEKKTIELMSKGFMNS